jgi:hypothetical protein
MSEPRTRATAIRRVAPGIRHWTIEDERIGFRSEAYAVQTPDGVIVLDPLPLTEAAAAALGPIALVCLTGGFHQRAAWTFRERFGTRVLAPVGARGLDGIPDGWIADGEHVARGLVALDRPGPRAPHFVFVAEGHAGAAALFCGDLLMRGEARPRRASRRPGADPRERAAAARHAGAAAVPGPRGARARRRGRQNP